MSLTVKVNLVRSPQSYPVIIGSGTLGSIGEMTRAIAGGNVRKAAVVSNQPVFSIFGRTVIRSLSKAGFKAFEIIIGNGERSKTFRTAERVIAELSRLGITRTDPVIALGGGVVGDVAGFAASLHLRGVPLLQIPTTLLSMVDSSVGGKTGVNTAFGKNRIGTFYQPRAVLIDTNTLATLPVREARAGIYEMVKHAALAGGQLFDRTADLVRELEVAGHVGLARGMAIDKLARLIGENIAFKASIVAGDEEEATDRTGPLSRKTLNFGHTFAHALENAAGYRFIRHGEAVGWGMLFAGELSKKLELLSENELRLLNDVVHRVGKLPDFSRIDPKKIIGSLRFDKKTAFGSLQWVLLAGIGKPVLVADETIPRQEISKTLSLIAGRRKTS